MRATLSFSAFKLVVNLCLLFDILPSDFRLEIFTSNILLKSISSLTFCGTSDMIFLYNLILSDAINFPPLDSVI